MYKLLTLATICLSLISTLPAKAQTNPKRGYIITNQNDTVWGTVDYLSTKKCVQYCMFQADGKKGFTKYTPTDIKAYRSADDIFYYERRKMTIDQVEQTVFAEYLVKGEVSLVHYPSIDQDHFWIIDRDGHEEIVETINTVNTTNDAIKQAMKHNMKGMTTIFGQHADAIAQIDEQTFDRRKLTAFVNKYNTSYCQDNTCILFQEKEVDKNSNTFRVKVGANLMHASFDADRVGSGKSMTFSGITGGINVGFDAYLFRSSRYFFLQGELGLQPYSYQVEDGAAGKGTQCSIKFTTIHLNIGPAYRFSDDETKTIPFIHAGFTLEAMPSMSMDTYHSGAYYFNGSTSFRDRYAIGFYAGAGVMIPVGHHQIEVNLDYRSHRYATMETSKNAVSLGVAYVF